MTEKGGGFTGIMAIVGLVRHRFLIKTGATGRRDRPFPAWNDPIEEAEMNVANLQLQGLYLAVAAINEALVAKGLLTRDEVETALARAEQIALGDDRVSESLNPANRDAVAFPVRLLAHANRTGQDGAAHGFAELARLVGATKGHYNDQE